MIILCTNFYNLLYCNIYTDHRRKLGRLSLKPPYSYLKHLTFPNLTLPVNKLC